MENNPTHRCKSISREFKRFDGDYITDECYGTGPMYLDSWLGETRSEYIGTRVVQFCPICGLKSTECVWDRLKTALKREIEYYGSSNGVRHTKDDEHGGRKI